MDRRFARGKAQLSKEFQITSFPSRHTLSYPAILRIEMLGSAGKAGWHPVFTCLIRLLRNISQESLVKLLQWLILIRQHIPCCRLALINPQVVVTVHQTSRQSREEDTDFKFLHLRISLDDAIIITVTVQEQQTILLTQGDTCLVEQTIVQSDILTLRLRSNLHHLERLEHDIISLGKSHYIGDKYGSTG